MTILIEYGPTVVVLRDRMERISADWPTGKVKAWLDRTDYSWVCSADTCTHVAGVMYKTPARAKKGAQKHAGEHPGATVRPVEEDT